MKNSGDNLDVGGVNMKMNKITQFLKRNVFYISMGVVIVGALVAVLLLPSGGNVQPDTNIPNKQVAGKVSENYEGEKIIVNDEMPTEEEMTSGDETDISEEKSLEPEDIQEQAQVEEQATTEEETEVAPTPEATTVPETEDEALNIEAAVSDESVSLFVNPVEENTPVVIDFTGDKIDREAKGNQGKAIPEHYYGVCYNADSGSKIYAIADGTIEAIKEDSNDLRDMYKNFDSSIPNIGQCVVLKLENGDEVIYGLSDGKMSNELHEGQTVQAGTVLGEAGDFMHSFKAEQGNVFLQVIHDNKSVDPIQYIETAEK